MQAAIPKLEAPKIPEIEERELPSAVPWKEPKGTLLPSPTDAIFARRLYFMERSYPALCQMTIDEQWKLGTTESTILREQRDKAIEQANSFHWHDALIGAAIGLIAGTALFGALR